MTYIKLGGVRAFPNAKPDKAQALGVTDLTPHLAACEERNRERGRYE